MTTAAHVEECRRECYPHRADATYVLDAIGVARVGLVGLGYKSDSLRQSRNRLLELANQIAEFWKADARQASIGGCHTE